MAISWIANAVISQSPNTDSTITLPTASMVVGDLIIIAASVADTTNNALAAPTVGGYTNVIGSTIYADDVNDVNLDVYYKYWNGTDTVATFSAVGGSNASNVAVCMIFRDVAPVANGGPFSTPAVQASGVSSSNADPAQIATETGCAVVIAGATGHTGGATATYTNPTNYTTNPGVRAHNDTIDGLVGMGYRLSGYANPENPGAFTAATIGTAADNAWAAVTMALKAYYKLVSGAAPTALATTKFAPTVTRATERFTHADQANSLTAEKTWTQYGGGTAWGIVSNQAKCSGSHDPEYSRLEIDADTSGTVTVEATLAAMTGGFYTHGGIFLGKDSTSTDTAYFLTARQDGSPHYFAFKNVGGVFTQLGSDFAVTPTAGDLLRITWVPATGALNFYVNDVNKLSTTDSSITSANKRGGVYYGSNDAAGSATLDNFYYSPLSQGTTVDCAAPTALVLTKYAPTVTALNPTLVSCAAPTALVTTKFAPTITTPQRVTGAAPTALLTATFAPTITTPQRVTGATPTALTLTTFAPTVTVPSPALVVPDTLNVFLTTFAPTVTAAAGLLITPETLGLTLTTYPPDVTGGGVTAMPIGTVPVRYLIGVIANVVPVITVLTSEAGVVMVREFVGTANVVPVREVTTEVPHVKVRKV